MVRIRDRWWGATVPLEPWVEITTGELLGMALGWHVAARMTELGAVKVEFMYNVQAVHGGASRRFAGDTLPECQRHPLQRALQWVVEEVPASHWWMWGHQEV